MYEFVEYNGKEYIIRHENMLYAFNSAMEAKLAIDTGTVQGKHDPLCLTGYAWRVYDDKGNEHCLTKDKTMLGLYRAKGFSVKPILKTV